ncbi:class I SAM-dependent methyltransferase [Mucilaginibacter boryungensis]|uniref:Class I SAM-dependent methyltransferase n=1 Tax=Mucilaginibacter boryungensis TaxID=768480 RepID=A0ABR9XJV1_9SPHI|nr:class I SAM-dependent methyltransferase [Mucilaginibacter boryungensis]MBE9667477.1 class I SAM-dependent methyltransferase [Mucilaginibacter boryungensis]
MSSNYNNAAWFYDRLSRMIYGDALVKAQTHFLHYIPANANVLIAGGGTGWLLEEIAKVHPSGLHISYVEISEKMMAQARKRNVGKNIITYVNSPIEAAILSSGFDVIITPFLLDSIPPVSFDEVFRHLHQLLKPAGLWLNTDFQLTDKWWQPLLLKSMYLFFKTIGCVENVDLPLIKKHFADYGYLTIDEQTFFREFVAATIYKK